MSNGNHAYEELLEILDEAFDFLGITYRQALDDNRGTNMDRRGAWMSPQVIAHMAGHIIDNLLCRYWDHDAEGQNPFDLEEFNEWVRNQDEDMEDEDDCE